MFLIGIKHCVYWDSGLCLLLGFWTVYIVRISDCVHCWDWKLCASLGCSQGSRGGAPGKPWIRGVGRRSRAEPLIGLRIAYASICQFLPIISTWNNILNVPNCLIQLIKEENWNCMLYNCQWDLLLCDLNVDLVFEFNQLVNIHCYVKHAQIKTNNSMNIQMG